MSREREQARKMLFVVHERVSTVVETRHLAESRVYRVRSGSSSIFEKSVCDMAGRCTWPLFCALCPKGDGEADGKIDSFQLIFAPPAGFVGFQFGRRVMTENTGR